MVNKVTQTAFPFPVTLSLCHILALCQVSRLCSVPGACPWRRFSCALGPVRISSPAGCGRRASNRVMCCCLPSASTSCQCLRTSASGRCPCPTCTPSRPPCPSGWSSCPGSSWRNRAPTCTCHSSPSSVASCWPPSPSCPSTCGGLSVPFLPHCASRFRIFSPERYYESQGSTISSC